MKTRNKISPAALLIGLLLVLAGVALLLVRLLRPEPVDPHAGQVYINDGFGMVWMTPLEGVPVNDLKQEDFLQINGEPVYRGEDYTVLKGIDVSEHQHEVDWTLASETLDFAMIRLGYRGYTEGGLFVDPFFEQNLTRAHRAGLDVGIYFFSQAVNMQEAMEEAEFVLEHLNGAQLELPIVFDWEKIDEAGVRTSGLPQETLNDCAVAFCETIRRAGYRPCVYFNRYLGYYGFDLSRLTDYEFWVAVPGDYPDFYYGFQYWQYSFDSQVPGVEGPTDLNLLFIPVPKAEGEESS